MIDTLVSCLLSFLRQWLFLGEANTVKKKLRKSYNSIWLSSE